MLCNKEEFQVELSHKIVLWKIFVVASARFPLLSACRRVLHLCNLPCVYILIRLISIARYAFKSSRICFRGTKHELNREHVTYLHSILYAGGRYYQGCHIFVLAWFSSGDVVALPQKVQWQISPPSPRYHQSNEPIIDLRVCKNINQLEPKGQILTLVSAWKWDSSPRKPGVFLSRRFATRVRRFAALSLISHLKRRKKSRKTSGTKVISWCFGIISFVEQFQIDCCITKTNPITYYFDRQSQKVVKPKP